MFFRLTATLGQSEFRNIGIFAPMAGIPPFIVFVNVKLFPLPDAIHDESFCYTEVLWIRSAIPEVPELIPGAAYVNLMSLPFIRLAEEEKARQRRAAGADAEKKRSQTHLKCLPNNNNNFVWIYSIYFSN